MKVFFTEKSQPLSVYGDFQLATGQVLPLYDALLESGAHFEVIEGREEETPMAWDADWDIEAVDARTAKPSGIEGAKELAIYGHAGASGYGRVEIRVPLTTKRDAANIDYCLSEVLPEFRTALEALGYRCE